ncbi:MAG: hypothetical protein WC637_13975 [Victivallales bacterium]|jgi:hypothetical protein
MKIKKILVVILLGCITTTVFAQFSIDLKKTAGSILGNEKKDTPAKKATDESPAKVKPEKPNALTQKSNTNETQKITKEDEPAKVTANESQKTDAKGNAYKTLSFGDDLKTIRGRLEELKLHGSDEQNDYSSNYYSSLPNEDIKLVDEYLKKNIKNEGLEYYYGRSISPTINEQSKLYLEVYPNYGLCYVKITFSCDFDTSLLNNKIQEDKELKETESDYMIYRLFQATIAGRFHIPFEIDVPYKKYTKTDKNGMYHEYVVYDFEKAELKESKDEKIKKILEDEENLIMRGLEEVKRKKPETKTITREEWRKGLISDFGKDTDFRKYVEGKLQEIKQKKYSGRESNLNVSNFFDPSSTLYTSYYVRSYKLEEARGYLKKNFEELKNKAISENNNIKKEKAKQAVDF